MSTLKKITVKSLDVAEDAYFSVIADKRIRQGGTFISHEEFWSRVLTESKGIL